MNTSRMNNAMKSFALTAAALLIALLPASPVAAADSAQWVGGKIELGRITIEPDTSGLPKQITIRPAATELPLELRGKAAGPDVLKWMGRGPQLRAPLRIEATVGGIKAAMTVADAAAPAAKDAGVAASARLTSGRLTVNLATRYEKDGAIFCTLAYTGTGEIDALELVADIDGTVDTVILGDAVAAAPQVYTARDYEPADEEGLVWGNSAKDANKAGKNAPGPVKRAYVGSGDRGFTFLCDDVTGWAVNPELSTLTLERDKAGNITWRTKLVNTKTTLGAAKTVNFVLLLHPATTPAVNRLHKAWLAWPDGAAKVLPVSLKGRSEMPAAPDAITRADVAAAFEACAPLAQMEGAAGGDMPDANHDLAAAYPHRLFRYLAGTHTGVTTRVKTNAAKLVPAGSAKAADRVLLGRALAMNFGVEGAGISHLAEAMRVLTIMQKTGLLESDGKTEFIPPWRNNTFIRYGEAFKPAEEFETTDQNPLANVYTCVYRRATAKGGTGAVIVIVNESDQPVREQLYIFDSARVFGGANVLTEGEMLSQLNFAKIPGDSDWRQPYIIGFRPREDAAGKNVLADLEDGGVGRQLPNLKAAPDVYGPVFVGAHDFRIIYGTNK